MPKTVHPHFIQIWVLYFNAPDLLVDEEIMVLLDHWLWFHMIGEMEGKWISLGKYKIE